MRLGGSMRTPLSSAHPLLFRLRVLQRRLLRKIRWTFGRENFATQKQTERLPHKVYRHQSKLKRALSENPRETLWQDNKVHNHALAIPLIDGIVIRPDETFSFWKLVGQPTAARGFKEGMELSMGRARGGIGGGLCQITNLIHWLALHSPLQVTQRANHSFDPFPDQGRIIPYGTGAALFYNYIDLWLHNPTDTTFQLRLWLTDTLVNGELRSDQPLDYRFRVFEGNGHFTRQGKTWYRHNEIWREKIAKGEQPQILGTEKLYENHVRVLYAAEPAACE
jgi:vancomycin resistance protein VanW